MWWWRAFFCPLAFCSQHARVVFSDGGDGTPGPVIDPNLFEHLDPKTREEVHDVLVQAEQQRLGALEDSRPPTGDLIPAHEDDSMDAAAVGLAETETGQLSEGKAELPNEDGDEIRFGPAHGYTDHNDHDEFGLEDLGPQIPMETVLSPVAQAHHDKKKVDFSSAEAEGFLVPPHTMRLTDRNFTEWIGREVAAQRTAFVRFVETNHSESGKLSAPAWSVVSKCVRAVGQTALLPCTSGLAQEHTTHAPPWRCCY